MINFLDTSAILNGALKDYHNIYVSSTALSELENIKTSLNKDKEVKYLAREAVRDILFNESICTYVPNEKRVNKYIKKSNRLKDIPDHHLLIESILCQNEEDEYINFITSDSALYIMAQTFSEITTTYYTPTKKVQEEYCGWRKVIPTDLELISLYSHPEINIFNALINEFIEIYEDGELKDIQFWNGKEYRSLKYKDFISVLGEKIKPRNLEQKMYLDLLQNKDIPVKMCVAKFGTGKSYLALNYALNELKQGVFDKIVFIKNNLEVKGAGTLGTLPGDEIDKQYPWLRQIEDSISAQKFEEYLETGMIEPAHLSTLRGRDLKNCCIIVDEAENLLDKNIQLLLGRVATGSEIIFCADIKQCDYQDEKMSGITKAIDCLKGDKLFGMVRLIKTERSVVSALADKLD